MRAFVYFTFDILYATWYYIGNSSCSLLPLCRQFHFIFNAIQTVYLLFRTTSYDDVCISIYIFSCYVWACACVTVWRDSIQMFVHSLAHIFRCECVCCAGENVMHAYIDLLPAIHNATDDLALIKLSNLIVDAHRRWKWCLYVRVCAQDGVGSDGRWVVS